MSDDDSGQGFCQRTTDAYPVPPSNVGAIDFTFGVIQILALPLIIYFVKKQSGVAKQMGRATMTDSRAEKAATNVLFPVYVKWLIWLAWTNVASGVANLFIPLDIGEKHDYLAGFAFPLTWAVNHFCLEGIAVLLSQRGVGEEASKRPVWWGTGFAIWTALILWPVFTFNPTAVTTGLSLAWEGTLMLFYGAIYLSPRTWFFRRPAAIHYGMFWFYIRVCNFSSRLLIYKGVDAGFCTYDIINWFGFGIAKNIVVYWVLLEDSHWWQGQFDLPGETNGKSSNLRDPLLGIDLKLDVAHHMAAAVDKIASFNISAPSTGTNEAYQFDSESSKRKEQLNVINFAYLQLDKSKLLGVGGSSKVFRGWYKNEKVAVKLLFVIDITPELIRRAVQEARTLSQFRRYVNVVKCYGVAVLPPCIAVVLELCERGSLYDVLKKNKDGTGLSWNERIGFALGAARGVLILHTAGIVHRDIKSMNFLVDDNYQVKIADLDLGGDESESKETAHLECLNWVPPEALKKEPYEMASDIYALGMVFYECCTSRVPFSNIQNPLELRQMVLDGKRPQLPSQTPTVIVKLIASMVHEDPNQRPDIKSVVGILKTLYQSNIRTIESKDSDFLLVEDGTRRGDAQIDGAPADNPALDEKSPIPTDAKPPTTGTAEAKQPVLPVEPQQEQEDNPYMSLPDEGGVGSDRV